MKITLPLPPTGNRYFALFRGRLVMTPEARRYKQGVKLRALTEGHRTPHVGNVVVSLIVYRKRKQGDLDNFQKILFDSLNGIAWIDDKQVVEIHARREDDAANPRVVVTVEECR